MKNLVFSFTVVFLVMSCAIGGNDSKTERTASTEAYTQVYQVYNEDSSPFEGTFDLVGIPLISGATFKDFEAEWGIFIDTFPGSTTRLSESPWEIQGKVNDGKISIVFPDEKLELTSDYENSFTEGVRLCQVHIEHKNKHNLKIGLHKMSSDESSRVYIFYANDAFNKLYSGRVGLKAGWNFIEVSRNPQWFYGSQEPSYTIGVISPDVNDFLKAGYCWQLERWI